MRTPRPFLILGLLFVAVAFLSVQSVMSATDISYDFTTDGLGDGVLSVTSVTWTWTNGTGYSMVPSGTGDKYITIKFNLAGAPATDSVSCTLWVYTESLGGGTLRIHGSSDDSTYTLCSAYPTLVDDTYTSVTGTLNPTGTVVCFRLLVSVSSSAGMNVIFKNFTITPSGTVDNFVVTCRDYSTLAGMTSGTFYTYFTDGSSSSVSVTKGSVIVAGDKAVNYVKYGDRTYYRSWNSNWTGQADQWYHLLSSGSAYYLYVINPCDDWGLNDLFVTYPPSVQTYQNFELDALTYDQKKLTYGKLALSYLTAGTYGYELIDDENDTNVHNWGSMALENPLYFEIACPETDTNVTMVPFNSTAFWSVNSTVDANWTAPSLSADFTSTMQSINGYALGHLGLTLLPLVMLLFVGKHYIWLMGMGVTGLSFIINIAIGSEVFSQTILGIVLFYCIIMAYGESER